MVRKQAVMQCNNCIFIWKIKRPSCRLMTSILHLLCVSVCHPLRLCSHSHDMQLCSCYSPTLQEALWASKEESKPNISDHTALSSSCFYFVFGCFSGCSGCSGLGSERGLVRVSSGPVSRSPTNSCVLAWYNVPQPSHWHCNCVTSPKVKQVNLKKIMFSVSVSCVPTVFLTHDL